MLFPDLFTDFTSAAAILYNAKNKIDMDDELENFYSELHDVEKSLKEYDISNDKYPPTFFIVEGLDGSGKTSLVESLAYSPTTSLSSSYSSKKIKLIEKATPMKRLKSVRKKFDTFVGDNAVIRAFYMATNYMLIHEMRQECLNAKSSLCYIVDRFYSSTCAYTVGGKEPSVNYDNNIDEYINSLPSDIFTWPSDLIKPDLVLLLQIDEQKRLERISLRPVVNNGNPWDDRLRQFPNMGQRIQKIMSKMNVPTCSIDANKNQVMVYIETLSTIENFLETKKSLKGYQLEDYGSCPLMEMLIHAQKNNLCDENGKRKRQKPFAISLATNSRLLHNNNDLLLPLPPPSLRQVGVNFINEYGIIFACRGTSPGGGSGDIMNDSECMYASFQYSDLTGSVENEIQYRGEGIIREVPASVAALISPVPSSLRHVINQCCTYESALPTTSVTSSSVSTSSSTAVASSLLLPGNRIELKDTNLFMEHTTYTTNNNSNNNETINAAKVYQLIPYRMEILRGSPSHHELPFRVEWHRLPESPVWVEKKRILPYSLQGSITPTVYPFERTNQHMTLVMLGSHTAGKKTIGERAANIRQWRFDEELGEILRDRNELKPESHRIGHGIGSNSINNNSSSNNSANTNDTTSNNNNLSWDDYIYEQEVNRDNNNNNNNNINSISANNFSTTTINHDKNRVVETWHIGNLAWALQRKYMTSTADEDEYKRQELIQKTRQAIEAEIKRGQRVLVVFLDISLETMIRRRANDLYNTSILLFEDEIKGAQILHTNIGERVKSILKDHQILSDFNIPVLYIDNNNDGDEAILNTVKQVLKFLSYYS